MIQGSTEEGLTQASEFALDMGVIIFQLRQEKMERVQMIAKMY